MRDGARGCRWGHGYAITTITREEYEAFERVRKQERHALEVGTLFSRASNARSWREPVRRIKDPQDPQGPHPQSESATPPCPGDARAAEGRAGEGSGRVA